MFFSGDNFVLTIAQAACIVLPAAGVPLRLQRFRTGAWALILPLNIAVVVFAIVLIPTTADVLTWVALLLIPPGAALAFGWAMRGARPWLAVLAAPLLALAWAAPDTRIGQIATTTIAMFTGRTSAHRPLRKRWSQSGTPAAGSAMHAACAIVSAKLSAEKNRAV